MLTDAPPREASRTRFLESERIRTLDLPQGGSLQALAKAIESEMGTAQSAVLRRACADFLRAVSEFYKVPSCGIRVLTARPLRVRENWKTELFGDYHPETMLIRVWMRTAVRKEVTSLGTFLSNALPRVLSPSRFPAFLFSGLVAYTRILRAGGCTLSSCARHALEATGLDSISTRSMAY